MDTCLEFIKIALTDDDVCTIYDSAILLELDDYKKLCEKRISLNSENVFKSDGFLECDRRVLSHILKLNLLSCSEIDVFKACLAWVKAVSQQNDPTKDILRAHLDELFYEIRFGSMTIQEFASLTPSYQHLFSYQEYQDIVQKIALNKFRSKMFKSQGREVEWNENAVIKCNRVSECTTEYCGLCETETTTFSTNQPILLGQFSCAELTIFHDDFS